MGGGHLTSIAGTGSGAFANKNCPHGRAFEPFFFQKPGVCPGVCSGGGVFAAGIDSHITATKIYGNLHSFYFGYVFDQWNLQLYAAAGPSGSTNDANS